MPYGQAVGQGYTFPRGMFAKIVVIFGQGEGLFVYNGNPELGNPPIASISNSTVDPYGNEITPSLTLAGLPELIYSDSPALGDLIAAISGAAGTDVFGNTYVDGIQVGGGGASWQVQFAGDGVTAPRKLIQRQYFQSRQGKHTVCQYGWHHCQPRQQYKFC